MNELLQLAVSGSVAGSLLLKVTLACALTMVVMRCTGRTRAAARHAVLAASFVLLLLLPLGSLIAPQVRVLVPVAVELEIVRASFQEVHGQPAAPAAHRVAEETNSAIAAVPADPLSFGPTVLLIIWLAGAMIFMIPVAAGVWQSRALRGSGIPWHEGITIARKLAREAGIDKDVHILLHGAVPGPMTCGAIRPIILLPLDAPAWSGEEMNRALTHELEHVRRGDWLSRCVARSICAAYWFHPLVWLTWRHFVLEAERACDDAVLRRSEPIAYADQLVVLAQRLLSESNQPILAMANRHDLAKRVSSLLDSKQRRGRAGGAWVALAGVTCGVLLFAISPLHVAARLQTPTPANTRKFDVAVVKPCKDEDFRNGNERRMETSFSPGRITVNCLPLFRIIYLAYTAIGSLDNPLVNASMGDPANLRGGPSWLQDETFYIEAKAEGMPDRMVMMGPMLRALLEDTFKLKTHRELQNEAMYKLTVAKGGLKIKPIGPDGCLSPDKGTLSEADRAAANQSDKPVCGNFRSVGNGWQRQIELGGTTMDRFANQILSGILDRHVMDGTTVEGRFNIKLVFGFDQRVREGVFGGRPVGPVREPPADVTPPPVVFTAIEQQLGLKLEPTSGARGFVVIDSVERQRQ
jgi:uncharacterized protein (TIGR03435 family)